METYFIDKQNSVSYSIPGSNCRLSDNTTQEPEEVPQVDFYVNSVKIKNRWKTAAIVFFVVSKILAIMLLYFIASSRSTEKEVKQLQIKIAEIEARVR